MAVTALLSAGSLPSAAPSFDAGATLLSLLTPCLAFPEEDLEGYHEPCRGMVFFLWEISRCLRAGNGELGQG